MPELKCFDHLRPPVVTRCHVVPSNPLWSCPFHQQTLHLAPKHPLTFPQIKQTLLEAGIVDDNAYCHILSGLGAGFFAVVCGSPVDVVKSRMMGG